ncbi:sensor histidine kinase [Paenibacillus sp. MMS20-IR301]|uniref:cache domain-containing sensor histidine kinase n=1 Tax=Paenibacillus sp. MMS20-IR301 TaxID=2895946 RepID=UPI0028E793AF|nr:sensor histidine kinase [Paenibacillus sp. MMS20-IR301]WNS45422.1 sensor histidine kinase [Paenibacillus sp. MMS20-IR301]
MRRRLNIPYGYKLVLPYVVCLLLAVVTVGMFAYSHSVNSLKQKTRENIQGTLGQIRDNITYRTDNIERISNTLYYNFNLQSALRRYDQGWYSYETMTKTLMPALENLLNYTASNVGLALYLENESIPELYYSDYGTNPLLTTKRYEIFHLQRIRDEAWYREFVLPEDSGGKGIWRQVLRDEANGNISLLRRMDDIQKQRGIGLIRVTVQMRDLLDSVDYRKIGGYASLAVTDGSGRIILESSPEDAAADPVRTSGNRLQLVEPLDSTGWLLQAYIPNSLFDESAGEVRRMTLLVCLISALVLAILGVSVSSYFTRRIQKIVGSLNAFHDGDFHKRIKYKGNDELAQIAVAFNRMGSSIEELIHKNYVADLQKKEAELESLQAQINPHFLYNTLSSISRLAQFGDIPKLHTLVQELAKFYRLSLNRGGIMTSVGKEIEHAKAYIAIQGIKYGERLLVYYDIDPGVLEYTTVKLILQPMIENVLEHAWFGGTIGIRLVAEKQGEKIVFKVIDNGIGMNPDTVRQILAPDGARIGYGIRNVDSRIKLHGGSEYGVIIASRTGIGTCVQITIPCRL